MPSCAAFGCTNRPGRKVPGLSFHIFPKNPIQREAWIIACRRKNWMPSNSSQLCSDHFTEDLIDRTSLSSVRLRSNAVPNVFKAFSSNVKNNRRIKVLKAVEEDESEEKSNSSYKDNLQHEKNRRKKVLKAVEEDESEEKSNSSYKVNFQHEKSDSESSNATPEYTDDLNYVDDSESSNAIAENTDDLNDVDDSESSDALPENTDDLNDVDGSESSGANPENTDDLNDVDDLESSNDTPEITDFNDVENSNKRRKIRDVTSSVKAVDAAASGSACQPYDREEIFGQYVASEMRFLRADPLLYLQTKQAILEILTNANFELINPK